MRKQLYYLFISMRQKQWIKNIIIFLPLIFSGEFLNTGGILKTGLIFLIFSIFTGATYVINDYKDRAKDRNHPEKKFRPLASGKLNPKFALISSIILLLGMLFLSCYFGGVFVLSVFVLYLINTICYTFWVKNIEILDIFSIALGFIFRGFIGAFTLNIVVSNWFLIMLFFGALRFGFLKRYQEVKLGYATRNILSKYNSHFLEQTISMITSIIVLAYSIYSFNSIQSHIMVITIPFVAFGMIRYYYNIFYLKKYSEGIENILLKDKFLLFDIIIYGIVVMLIVLLNK